MIDLILTQIQHAPAAEALWALASKTPYVFAILIVVVLFMRYIKGRDDASATRDMALQGMLKTTGEKYEQVLRENSTALWQLKGSIDQLDRSVQDLRQDRASARPFNPPKET